MFAIIRIPDYSKSLLRLVTVAAFAATILCSGLAKADRGSISPGPVKLHEDSQRGIIFHNFTEEILILGTELRAEQESGVLEFIPFPSEPTVTLAAGDPFGEIQRVLKEKKIELEKADSFSKGGGGGKTSVNIRFSGKIGLHDVTVIRINEINGFIKWVADFFNKKGIKVENDLGAFHANAADYVKRGIEYFVFDYVSLGVEKRHVEPLLYRFVSPKIYYPLKTSNIVGGAGLIDLIFITPGSIPGEKLEMPPGLMSNFFYPYYKFSEVPRVAFDLSNSAKIKPAELISVYPEAEKFFSKNARLFIQVMSYSGPYNFTDDLFVETAKLQPVWYFWDTFGSSHPWDATNILRPEK